MGKKKFTKPNILLIFLVFTFFIAPVESLSYTANDALVFTTQPDGDMQVSYHRPLAEIGFAIEGTVLALSQDYNNENYLWVWTEENFTVIQEEYDFKTGELINVTYYGKIFTGSNLDRRFSWTQVWTFHPFDYTKVKNIITNDLGFSLMDVEFIYDIDTKQRLLSTTNNIHAFAEFDFDYQDLIDNDFSIAPSLTDSRPRFTTATGTFSNGQRIELDPLVTAYKSPTTTGDPTNQWTNPDNILTSNNARASTTTLGHIMDTSGYDFSGIPINSEIVGIEVSLEGLGS